VYIGLRNCAINIEIHNPELAQRVNAHIQTGQFHDADDLIEKALDALDEKSPAPGSFSTTPAKNLVELFSPVQGLLTDEEVDTLFTRNPSTSRPLDLA